MKVTFEKLYSWYTKSKLKSGEKLEYPTLESYITAYRSRYSITSTTEVEFGRDSKPIPK